MVRYSYPCGNSVPPPRYKNIPPHAHTVGAVILRQTFWTWQTESSPECCNNLPNTPHAHSSTSKEDGKPHADATPLNQTSPMPLGIVAKTGALFYLRNLFMVWTWNGATLGRGADDVFRFREMGRSMYIHEPLSDLLMHSPWRHYKCVLTQCGIYEAWIVPLLPHYSCHFFNDANSWPAHSA